MNGRARTVFSISEFKCLARVKEAHLEGDEVVGRLSSEPVFVAEDPARIVERLANWGNSPQDILHFTRTQGLLLREHSAEEPRDPFRFKLSFWRAWQNRNKARWQIQSRRRSQSKVPPIVEHGEHFLLNPDGGHAFHFNSLYRLIDFWLSTLPKENLKRCPCCKKYFVASTRQQRYCGNRQCSEWSRRQTKLRTWHKNKARYRQANRYPISPKAQILKAAEGSLPYPRIRARA
jgi:hypothetical protein